MLGVVIVLMENPADEWFLKNMLSVKRKCLQL